MLTPFRSTEFFETLILSLDLILYGINSRQSPYDFFHIFVENFTQFCFQIISLYIFQFFLDKKTEQIHE